MVGCEEDGSHSIMMIEFHVKCVSMALMLACPYPMKLLASYLRSCTEYRYIWIKLRAIPEYWAR